jgi:N-methylhydantoinase A/oxoprolinase/acetone carboxylase beta subunit
VPHDLRFGVGGRIDWRGSEIEPLNLSDIDLAIEKITRRSIGAVAVSFLFSFLNPAHEQKVRQRFAELAPNVTVILSSDVNPEIKEYERASTTVIAAALSPLVERVLSTLEGKLASTGVPAKPQIIKSNGGIMSAASARSKPLEMVRSGPAGGVASALRFSRELGLPNLITVDIGGTTADVAVVTDGRATYTQQANIEWDIPLRVAMADVRSVGAGGGSIATLDAARRLKVGPESARANPGPVCYGRGGTVPTVTDAAIVARHLDPAHFLGGRMSIDAHAAEQAIRVHVAGPLDMTSEEAACGVLRLAGVRMAQLINEMTVQVGLDPRDYVLVGFGGAGPLFLSALVEEIEAEKGIVPLYPSVWSAFGGLYADIVHDYARSCIGLVDELDLSALDRLAANLAELARSDLERDGVAFRDAQLRYSLDLRYVGQSHEITVPLSNVPPFKRESLREASAAFSQLHEQMFSHRRVDPCQLVTMRLSARAERRLRLPHANLPATEKPIPMRETPVWFHGQPEPLPTKMLQREALPVDFSIEGPAIIVESQAHSVVTPGMKATIGRHGEIIMTRAES